MIDWQPLASDIWNQVNLGCPFPWPKSEKVHGKLVASLSRLLPNEDINAAFGFDDKPIANRNLRRCVSPYLAGGDRETADNLAVWIVREWGGIKSGSETVPTWSTELGDFSPQSVSAFIDRMGTSRISSWSKLLAFAVPENEAIYDARTAVGLNCALANMGHRAGFHMPIGRNRHIVPAHKKLRASGFSTIYGYREYVSLLRAIAANNKLQDILDVEMSLFASAPAVASKYAR